MRGLRIAGALGGGLLVLGIGFGIGFAQTSTEGTSPSYDLRIATPGGPADSTANRATAGVPTPARTTVPCSLSATSGTVPSVPVYEVCSSDGIPHFDSPQQAMVYLTSAWNRHDVQGIDYVTDPAGRQEMDEMAAQMVNLKFEHCGENPAGDYTCFFRHDITPSTSPTTYPNPGGYPAGEAVFTVAPAAGPGWYLTYVIHCG